MLGAHPTPEPEPPSPSSPLPPTGAVGLGASEMQSYESGKQDEAASPLYGVWLVLVIAVVLRLVFLGLGPLSAPERAITEATAAHQTLAENLLSDQVYAMATENRAAVDAEVDEVRLALGQLETHDESGLVYETRRTPGYAGLLAGLSFAGLPTLALLALQCLFSGAAAAMVYAMTRSLFPTSRHAPWVAGLIVAIHPAAVGSAVALNPETLFVFLTLCGVVCMAIKKSPSAPGAFLGGLLFGAALLFRPYTVALGPLLAVWHFGRNRNGAAFTAAVLFAVASLIAPAAWVYRNHEIGFGYRLSSEPLINAYFHDTGHMRFGDGQSSLAVHNDDAIRQHLVHDWFNESDLKVDGFESLQAVNAQAGDSFSVERWEQVGKRSLSHTTVESVTPFLSLLGIESGLGESRDVRTLGTMPGPGVQDPNLYHFATGWIGVNALMITLAMSGAVLLVTRRQRAALLLTGGLLGYFLWQGYPSGEEPFRVLLLCLQAVLVASLLTPPAERRPKRSLRKELNDPFVPGMDPEMQPQVDATDKAPEPEAPAAAFAPREAESENPVASPPPLPDAPFTPNEPVKHDTATPIGRPI